MSKTKGKETPPWTTRTRASGPSCFCAQPDVEKMINCIVCNRWIHFECAKVPIDRVMKAWTCKTCEEAQAFGSATNRPVNKPVDQFPKSASSIQCNTPIPQSPFLGSDPIAPQILPTTQTSSGMEQHNASENTGLYNAGSSNSKLQTEGERPPASVFRSLKSSRKSVRKELMIKKLEEEMLSKEKLLDQEMLDKERLLEEESRRLMEAKTKILKERRIAKERARQDFLVKKYDMLSISSDNDSISHVSCESIANDVRVEDWVRKGKSLGERTAEQIKSPRGTELLQHCGQRRSQLSSAELAARSAMAKDLPIFSGDSIEWSIFYSHFKMSTKECGYSNAENLLRLQRCLRGSAYNAVKYQLTEPDNVNRVLETLRMLFGRPEIIISSLINKIRQDPLPKADDLSTLISFSLSVQNLRGTMEASGLTDHLNNPTLLQELVQRLPSQIRLSWGEYKMLNVDTPNLSVFSEWLYAKAKAACEVTTVPLVNFDRKQEGRGEKRERYLNTTDLVRREESNPPNMQSRQRSCVSCNGQGHAITDCQTFQRLSRREKWNVALKYHLCRACLGRHNWFQCRDKKPCKIDGCDRLHHPMLHNKTTNGNSSGTSKSDYKNGDSGKKNTCAGSSKDCHTHRKPTQTARFRIAPVKLVGPKAEIDAFAFFDEGSSLTLIDEDLADELGICGKKEQLCLRWTGGTTREEANSRKISVSIRGVGEKKFVLQGVRTVKKLDLPEQTLDVTSLFDKHRHLRGLPIESYSKAIPKLLIGQDNYRVALPLDVREGGENDPVATKTRLGWVVGGCSDIVDDSSAAVHHSFHLCKCSSSDMELTELVKEFYVQERYGASKSDVILESKEDTRARQLLQTTTTKLQERYQTGLLWRFNEVKLPDSYPMAYRRLCCLERKMERDPVLNDKMKEVIADYAAKGYIRRLTPEEITTGPKTWYLPIFTVVNPNKPGKFRIVWDAAAKVANISLNDNLLKGPDLVKPLADVLLRFRERRVAISGDIKEMFHQVVISTEDQDAQRFLWRNGDKSIDPDIYVMCVMTFGASCSPCSAQYVKNLNAYDFRQQFPRAVTAITDNHYVDDWLDSADDEGEAIKLAREVHAIHAKAGFEIRNWQSNSPALLKELGGNAEANRQLPCEQLIEDTKILGMWWNTRTDTFKYSVNKNRIDAALLDGRRRPTKREVLRVTMSIFDPLGLIAQFLVFAKVLMQYVWRSKIDWDDEIQTDENEKWKIWTGLLPEIEKVTVPRCYLSSSTLGNARSVQLHTFVDASEDAYAAVAYLRFETDVGITCSLVAAKTKVSPLQPTSIPRLELQASVIGARLAKSILNAQTFKVNRQVFWSDSKTVISWLKSDQRRFKQFVALRVAEIAEITNIEDWRWIPTKENVADEATKWRGKQTISSSSRWYTGPNFLYSNEKEWPISNNLNEPFTVEVEEECRMLVHTSKPTNSLESIIDVKRFSRWRILRRTMALVLRFGKKKNRRQNFIDCEELEEAEQKILHLVQLSEFRDEIKAVEDNSCKKFNRFRHLSPFIDEFGLIRHDGRIKAAEEITYDMKYPIILPKRHHVTDLIVADCHRRYHHYHDESVVNELRQRFLIPQLRVVLKSVKRRCQWCKIVRARPVPPQMGDLPPARLSTFMRPFSYTGIDYFGPMEVAVGRRIEKRWGVLFTCLTVRAVHLEVACSLTTDSCILAVRTFIARRGKPIEFYSDQGTNFCGLDNELRRELQKVNPTEMADYFDAIKWKFNPAGAPHMGGIWERLVRSVKTCLRDVLPSRRPTDELLRSILAEIENIINSRPLTYVPLENDSNEALTPNHFLLGSSNGMKPPAIISDDALILRKNWKISQVIADRFWRRWIQEYLPTISRRTKWFEKVKNVKIGDLVIIMEENRRNSWTRGIVVDTNVGKDGQVRSVVVKTSNGIFSRPVVKVAVLDVKPDVNEPTASEELPVAISQNV